MIDVEAQREADSKLTEEEKRENVIRYAFGGDRAKFDEFCRVLGERLPAETVVVIGGSSVTGHNYLEGAPFDAEGPGTSDLDIYMIGEAATQFFTLNGFWIPGIHSHPIKDGDEEIAPGLKDLRNELKQIAGREVTLQATQNFYYWFREKMLGQTYLTLVGELDETQDAADNEL